MQQSHSAHECESHPVCSSALAPPARFSPGNSMQDHTEGPPGPGTRFITCGASVDVNPDTAQFVPHPAPDGTLWDMETIRDVF